MKIFTKSVLALTTLISTTLLGQQVSTFEDLKLSTNSYWDGAPSNNKPFQSGIAFFENSYSSQYGGYWAGGFAYSNSKNNTTEGYTNMYSAITGKGAEGSQTYAVVKDGSTIKFASYPRMEYIDGMYVTNSTYAALSMKNGDSFAKKFGGTTGNDPDYFLLTVSGFFQGKEIETKVPFYLADFRFADNSKDYIVKTWKWLDLRSLGFVDSLKFSLSSSDTSKFGINTPAYFCLDNFNQPYFEDVAGAATSTAIYQDSSAIKAWASSVVVNRGFVNIAKDSLGKATYGIDANGTGKANATVVSLGDGGSAIASFDNYITDGIGPDFCIFENGFDHSYLELATVEVSSDGINYFAFPAVSNTSDSVQVGGFGTLNTKLLHNLAGKYKAKYGTPFNLSDLKNVAGLDVNKITNVKIVDVVGNIGKYATYDINGNAINDPWSTPYTSSGFDLDAIGVINQAGVVTESSEQLVNTANIQLYPNPASTKVKISGYTGTLQLVSSVGEVIIEMNIENETNLNIENLRSGVYFIKTDSTTSKLIKQ